MVENILDFLQHIHPVFVYLFLTVSTFVENVFPPWPGDTFIVFAGFLYYHRLIDVYFTFLAILTGNFLGTSLMFFFGRNILEFAHEIHQKARPGLVKNFLEDLISENKLQATQKWFSQWGFYFVASSRFFAGIRFFVSIVAGMAKMNFFLFSLAFFIGVILWNVILFSGGYYLAENWKQVLEWLRYYNILITFIIVILILFFLYIRKLRRQI